MRPGVSSHCRPSRNRQDGDLRAGTVKARRPRASAVEAKRRALHGAEHRSSMDRVMAGASAVVQIVVIFRARTRTCCFAASLLSIGGGIRPCIASSNHSRFMAQIFPDERDQIVRTIWF
jgi:Mg2+/Co2+ transporter CorC